MRIKKYLGNILVSCITVFFCLILLEVGLRLFFPQSGHFYEPDPELGSRLIPSHSGIWRTEGRVVPIQINQFGFRGWNYPFEKATDTVRVAVVGDSYVEAVQVEEQEMFTRLLEQDLNEKDSGRRYEVLSFGVSGYGTAQEYLLWSSEVKKFHPDVVILAFTSGNDVRNNVPALEEHSSKPYFIVKEDRLVLVPPIIRSDNMFGSVNRFLLSSSHLYRFALSRSRHLPWAKTMLVQNEVPTDYGVYTCEYTQTWQDAWQLTEKLIHVMQEEVKQAGARFVLVNLTSYIQIQEEAGIKEATDRYPAMEDLCWDLNKPNKVLEEFAQKNNLFYLDLLPSFVQEYQATGRQLHLLKDGHWNSDGHALAASRIADFLRQTSF